MKGKWTSKKLIRLYVPIMSVIAAVMLALFVATLVFAVNDGRNSIISNFLFGIGGSELSQDTLTAGKELCEEIGRDGTVLLKNSGQNGSKALPLSEAEAKKINVFGWAAYDWMTSTFGSGFSNTELEKLKLFPALEQASIEYNTELYDMYKDFYTGSIGTQWSKSDWNEYRGDVAVGSTKKFILHEPGESFYTSDIIDSARAFSSVALVVIGRTGGEAADLRLYQEKQIQSNGSSSTVRDDTRTYLQLSTEEEQMINAAASACDKVIVVLNVSNTMELGFLDDDRIDAALLSGLTGMNGVNGVIDVLRGKDRDGNVVSPSGRTADTYAYDIDSAPSSVNSGYGGALKYTGLATSGSYTKGYYDAYIDYHEGIYVGYRYYETAAEANYINYDETVQYPFGYGLSYTDFEYSVDKLIVNGEETEITDALALGGSDKLELYVNVKNTGDVAGREVVQLYYTAPYIPNGIEKSHVVLGDFAKTELIQPSDTKQVKLEITAQGMASYDCYDLNNNKHTGYELDEGTYVLRLMKNSHEPAPMADGASSTISFGLASKINYDTDEKTGKPVVNRFTGNDTIDGYPIDGSLETVPVTYLSRANFAGTFPKTKIVRGINKDAEALAKSQAPTAEQLEKTGYGNITEEPLTANDQGFSLEDMADADGYDDEFWSTLVGQITKTELFENIRNGFFNTVKIDSIGKDSFVDLDGPLGLNTRVMSNTSCRFISYPGETLLAQTFDTTLAYRMGLSVGREARDSDSGIRGWYGPAANIHRNPYCGRNGEYYSEDALLSGRFAAEAVRGAKNNGLYCYIKHFAANDSETLREGLFTFMSEQTFREIYLKPYEITVKEGGGNAMMTSMNRIGAVWAGASRALCTDVLRGEWEFNGTLVTDWVDTGKGGYMPVYKGIWAGNDIWLNNPISQSLFDNKDYNNHPVFITLAQKVAHDTLWTLVDTQQVSAAYDPANDRALGGGGSSGGSRAWVWIAVAVEVVLAVPIGVFTWLIVKRKREENADGSGVKTYGGST